MQRHHLLPRQLLKQPAFFRLIDQVGRTRLGFEDFRRNGMLLPSTEDTASLVGLPLHRGPHRLYNDMVFDRFGQIEARWSQMRARAPEAALDEAVMRLGLLQGGLRRRLMQSRTRPFLLNRRDPLGAGLDFAELDAMADALWASVGSEVVADLGPERNAVLQARTA